MFVIRWSRSFHHPTSKSNPSHIRDQTDMVELEILTAFADEPGSRSAAEIAASSGVPRSTVFRTLRRLAEHGFVHQDPATRRYILGPRVAQLGLAARRQLAAGYPVVEPILALARATSETVSFSLTEVPWRVCAYSIEAPSDLRQVVKVGDRYPLHLGAGRAILAFLPTSTIRRSSSSTALRPPKSHPRWQS